MSLLSSLLLLVTPWRRSQSENGRDRTVSAPVSTTDTEAADPEAESAPSSRAGTITCRACQASNPPGAKFCLQCGAATTNNCSKCGIELPEEARFCLNCGEPLVEVQADTSLDRLRQYIPQALLNKLEGARTSGSVQGERRIVTMLFCDVRGSTAAAERLDPEEWTEIMNGAFEHLIAPVYRYEGTLARLMGDAILAFFGAPIAHEDDPQRAVLAGLDMVQGISQYREEVKLKWGLDFSVRVGINTGLVVVGEVGSDLRVEYTAMGDAINLAARMEQTAQPDTVQVAEDTYRLIRPLFDFEDLGGIEAKGKSEPVQAYRVLSPKEEPDRLRGIEGLDAPLIGRDQEMETLRSKLTELCQGRGQIISVMGDAGLGKSRLIAELRKALVAEGLLSDSNARSVEGSDQETVGTFDWHEGRCVSYKMSTPYAPIRNLFEVCFGLQAGQSDLENYNRISERISRVFPDRVLETAPLIATMMGIKLTGEADEMVKYIPPSQVRDRIFRAIGEVIEGLTSLRPLVIVVEDLHWADPTSLDLIESLMPLTDRVPLMIICVYRPGRQDPSWRFHESAIRDYFHRYTQISLEPLDEDHSRMLVDCLLPIEDLPGRVRDLIFSRAEGNPLFVEEVLRSLLDAGVVVQENSHWRATGDIENIPVPDTLAGVITARLDRLGEESKRVAQTASVIGREFRFDALTSIHEGPHFLNDSLVDLEKRELIRERSRLPQHVYLFKHALSQETAYASLLLRQRRELHRRLAEFLERIDPDQVGEIARHFLEAQEEARALPYLVEAGDRAAKAYSLPEAIEYYTIALKGLEPTQDLQLVRRVYEGLGGALTSANEVQRALENYQAMRQVAEEHGDIPMKVSALNKLGFVTALVQGHYLEAEQEYLVESEQLANSCNDFPGLAEIHVIQCYLRVPFGEFDEAITHLEESARIGRELDLEEPKLFGMTHRANALTYLTNFEEAHEATQEAMQAAKELGNRKWEAELLALSSAFYHLRNGDLSAACQVAEEGKNLAAQIGAPEQETYGAILLALIAWLRGEYEGALTQLQQALESGRKTGLPFLEAVPLCTLGTTYLEISGQHLDQTNELHSQALEIMEKPLGAVMGTFMWVQIGFCALALGDLERANEFFQKGLNIPTAMRFLVRPQLLVGSAFVALARNGLDEAEQLVSEARDFVAERDMKHLYPLVALAEAQVNVAKGQSERALEDLERCESLALEMQMRPLVLQARLGAAQVLNESGQSVKADAKQHDARAMIEEMAGLFQDDALRRSFIESSESKLA